MIRDYKSRASTKKRKSGSMFLPGLFTGYILGLASAIAVWLYISQAPSPYLTEDKTASSQTPPKVTTQPAAPKDTPANKNTTQADKPRFDFYKILPGIEESSGEDLFEPAPIPAPPKAAAVADRPERKSEKSAPEKPSASPTQKNLYFLQAGSFRNPNEAEKIKAELALLGVVASVQTGRAKDNSLLHRVRIGPFAKMDDLDRMRASLQMNGITASLVRVTADSTQ